jgi:DNA modification methylase
MLYLDQRCISFSINVDKIHTGECLQFIKRLPDKSIDFCMTSPPYWRMRDYGTKGQVGQEKTPEEYIEKLVTIFRELKRILCYYN